MMVAGTHFPHDADPADVAWKLVAVNFSDLAAKGATPLGVLLGYMLGTADWDRAFVSALGDALATYGAALWGGDTVAAPADRPHTARAIGLTAIGRATHLPLPGRAGAQAGDTVWMTGEAGAALAGYLTDRGELLASAASVQRFRRPEPRLEAGQRLAPLVTAMMDVSDGLLLDATRLATASGVTIALDSAALPIAADLTTAALRDRALRWGDDYELLFTLPQRCKIGIDATRIGSVVHAGPHPLLIDGQPLPAGEALGWQHNRVNGKA